MTYVVKIYRSIEVLWKNVYCHQLLGTGNDMRERIYKMADEIFETWPPAMLQLFEEQSQAEAETQQLNAAKQLLSTNVTQQIETLNEESIRLSDHQVYFQNRHQGRVHPQVIRAFNLECTRRERGIASQKSNLKKSLTQYNERIKTSKATVSAAKKKLTKAKEGRNYKEKPTKLELNNIFEKYGITPQQYHSGAFVGNHVRKFMEHAKKLLDEISDLFKSCGDRRKTKNETEAMSDEDIEKQIGTFADLLVFADTIYSTCHRPAGTLTDEELEDVHETIEIFSKMWRVAGLSITIKAHIIEAHLIDYLRRFRGLGEYDEEFGERAHQDGLRHDKRTSNVKSFDEKANMYARHDRMVKHPSVLEEVKIYEAGRPKRSSGDARLVSSRMNKVAKKAERDDQRNDVKREHKDYLK